MRTTEITPGPCPSCGATTTAASGRGSQQPAPGDFSICFHCFAVCRFDAALRLAGPVPDALIPADVAQAVERFKAFRRRGLH